MSRAVDIALEHLVNAAAIAHPVQAPMCVTAAAGTGQHNSIIYHSATGL